MSGLLRKSAVFATTATLAFSVAAAPVAAKGDKGHHKTWTTAKCTDHAQKWVKAHKHPSAKQVDHENKSLAKHGCTNTV